MLEGVVISNDNLVSDRHDWAATAREAYPAAAARAQGCASFGGDPLSDQILAQWPGFLCVLEGAPALVSFANAACQRLMPTSSLGVPFAETALAALPGLSVQVARAFSTGEPAALRRLAVLSPSGAPLVVDFVAQPIRIEGRVVAVMLQGTDVTDQAASEAMMQAGLERAESILNALGDGFVAFDEEMRAVKLNAAALAYDGREANAILGKTHWEAWPTSAGSFLEGVYQQCFDEQRQITIERHYLGFGKDRWLELRLCPVVGGIVTFFRDVTDRKLSEEALRASEERFRALVDAVPHLVWEASPDGQIEWFNERFGAYSGMSLVALQGGGWRQVLHPDDYETIAGAWRQAREQGSVFEREIRLRRGIDGVYRWFLAKGVPVRNGEGAITRWIGTNTEIHDERAAASELVQRNSRLEERVEESTRDRERLWRLSTDLMLVTDLSGRILAMNPAWRRVLDWSDDDLHGRSFVDLVHTDARDLVQAQVADLALGVVTFDGPIQLRHRDGTYRWIAWKAVPGEQFIHAVGRDITTEKAASDALREAEAALRQSQKMEAVGQLTGGIAHDFNNLLTGVIGSLDLLESRLGQGRMGDAARYIEAAMSSARRAAALTHRLLAFSRRQPLDPRPVNANDLVASMDELFRRTVTEAVRVTFVPKDDLWLTSCDANQLESALLNLVINARDSMTGSGTIVIRSDNVAADDPSLAGRCDLAADDYVMLSVTDTGSGMSQDVTERVFEPFFTTKPIGQGTGLGLSMVYGFVRQSGGQVGIVSEPGQGTTVTIHLPRFRGDAAHSAAPDVIAAGHARAGEIVFVVEDEPVVRRLVVDMLQERGYRIIEAMDGPSALAVLQTTQPVDLLLTDVGLPGLNGRQLADAARELRPDLNILFMTGYVDNEILKNGFLGPRMEVIAKPFAGEALAAKVEHMIHD
ncbi:PAS domain-containing hybrid sensor histidine kinase/response regulator [Microvirga antarctica]|uniref:PAS domain-containing hybrid sensor histidine kinase/response regulator n=1 Tax=Microvirga antarctica TaxID=2819233 RepID=UPI001B303AF4|nr:PAS domain-containing sensor histidine kinase [Microvirga antarctica]